MCLSLIQENVGLYSSYFIKKYDEEDIELDVIIPIPRIPNWSEKMDILLNDKNKDIENAMDAQYVTLPGIEENDPDSENCSSSSGTEVESGEDSSSDSNDDNESEDENQNEDSEEETEHGVENEDEDENQNEDSEDETEHDAEREDEENDSSSSSDSSDSENISVISG